MSLVLANGEPVESGTIRLPRVGAWHADLVVLRETAEAIEGRVEIRIGEALSFVGTARRSGPDRGVVHVRVVGGAGGLATELGPKAYQGVPLQLPLQDLAGETGEMLSPASSPDLLGIVLPYWARPAGPAGRALVALLAAASDGAWRVLADGTLWVGRETWPPAVLDGLEYSTLSQAPQFGTAEIAALDPRVFPGETLSGRRVSVVEHRFSPAGIRTTLQLEDASLGILDRVKEAIGAYVRTLFARIDFFAGYWCRVVAQNADGSLELLPDDARIPGHSNVPIRYPIPGMKLSVAPGARALLEFAAGDPSKPFVSAFESGTATKLEVTATEVDVTAPTVNVTATTVTVNGGLFPVAKEGSPLTGTAGPFALSGTVAVGGGSAGVRVP